MPHRLSRCLLAAAAASLTTAGPALASARTTHAPWRYGIVFRHETHRRHTTPRHHKIFRRHHHIAEMGSATMPGRSFVPLSLPTPTYRVANDAQLTAALQQASPGAVIQLDSGAQFSQITDNKVRSGWVTVSGAGDAVAPVVAGAKLLGTHDLRFTNVKFAHAVSIGPSPYGGHAPAANVAVLNSELDCGATGTVGGGTAIGVRQGAQNITFSGDYVHDCTVGFASIAQDIPSDNVSITHNLFEDFYGDAIDLGAMHDLTIADNVIRDIAHTPGNTWHDDGIQFLGNTSDTTIADNVLANSLDQLILIQDAVKGQTTGTSVNTNILVAHNLLYGNTAYAVQSQGALQTSFIDNTIWDNGDGSLLLRRSTYTGIAPTDTVVEGNILQTYGTIGVRPAVEQDNLIQHTGTGFAAGPGDIVGVSPSFVDAASGAFELVPGTTGSGSPPVSATTGTTTPTAIAMPASTSSSTPALGAFAPDAPQIGYGAPRWGVG